MIMRHENLGPAFASVLAACYLALSATAAVAAESPATEPASAEPAAAAEPATAEPAAAAEPVTATPAQSGADEYGEDGVPTGTGEDDDEPAPVEDDEDTAPAPDPTPSTPAAPSASGETDATDEVPAGSELPRTGSDAAWIALIALALLATGTAIRRRGIAAPRA